MPLTINVGLSRKASENYQSTGLSINVTAELDQSLLARPQELQNQVEQLYQQAETALDRQTARQERASGRPRAIAQAGRPHASPAPSGDNGHGGNGKSSPAPAGTMTQSQGRAIAAIAKRMGLDAPAECREVFGLDLTGLSVRQASEFIDHLKSLTSTSQGGRQ